MKPTELELNLLPLIQEEQIRGENLGTVRIEKQKLTEAEKQLKLLESIRLRVAKKDKTGTNLESAGRGGAFSDWCCSRNAERKKTWMSGFKMLKKRKPRLKK